MTHFIEIDWSHLPRKCNMLRLSYGIQSNVIRPKIKDFELEAFLNPSLKMSHFMSKDKRACYTITLPANRQVGMCIFVMIDIFCLWNI